MDKADLLEELLVERHRPVPRANYARDLERIIDRLNSELKVVEGERDLATARANEAETRIRILEQRMMEHRCRPTLRVTA